jgi:hypothetical protein
MSELEKHEVPGPMLDPEKGSQEVLPELTEDAIRSGSIVPEQILKHSHDADVALKAFAEFQGQVIEIDEETNRRLLRKIDWHLMPVCGILIRADVIKLIMSSDYVRRLRPELPRQDYAKLCLNHGHI